MGARAPSKRYCQSNKANNNKGLLFYFEHLKQIVKTLLMVCDVQVLHQPAPRASPCKWADFSSVAGS